MSKAEHFRLRTTGDTLLQALKVAGWLAGCQVGIQQGWAQVPVTVEFPLGRARTGPHRYSSCYAIGPLDFLQAGTQGPSAYTCPFRQFACLGPHMIRGPGAAGGPWSGSTPGSHTHT